MKKPYLPPGVVAVSLLSDELCLLPGSSSPSPSSAPSVSVDYEEGVWEGDVKSIYRGRDLWE